MCCPCCRSKTAPAPAPTLVHYPQNSPVSSAREHSEQRSEQHADTPRPATTTHRSSISPAVVRYEVHPVKNESVDKSTPSFRRMWDALTKADR